MRFQKQAAALAVATALLAGAAFYSVSGTNLKAPQEAQAAGFQNLTFKPAQDSDAYIVEKCSSEASGYLEVPSTTPEGYPVIGIAENAFSGCEALTAVYLPDSIQSIGEMAFLECRNLRSVNIPEGIQVIEMGCFGVCSSLTEITIPEGVKKIRAHAFDQCAISELTIPSTVELIEEDVFAGCANLQTLTVLNPSLLFSGLGVAPQLIRGYSGSSAERYARASEVAFEPIDDVPGEPVFCDADGNGEITALDAQYVMMYYLEDMLGNEPSWKEITGNQNAPD